MRFVKLGNWNVRADRIVAVNTCVADKCITIYCGAEENYAMYFKTQDETCKAYKALMQELEKIEIGTKSEE